MLLGGSVIKSIMVAVLHMYFFVSIYDFLALLIRKGYAIPNFCVVRLRCSHRCRKLFVQTLSPLKFMD